MQAPIALLLFLITQSSPLSESPYFWSKKYIAFSIIRNCMYKRDMEFRPFYLLHCEFCGRAIRPKLCGNCAFRQKFSTRKLCEITGFSAEFLRHFVCNLNIHLINSVITPFKVLNISFAGSQIFWLWIETEPYNKSIFVSI